MRAKIACGALQAGHRIAGFVSLPSSMTAIFTRNLQNDKS
jgi:hypothetical protein